MPVEVFKSSGKIIIPGNGVLRKNSDGVWGYQKEKNDIAKPAEPFDLVAFLNQEERRWEMSKANGGTNGK